MLLSWTADQMSLPAGWERRLHNATGKYYFINHATKSTQWEHPLSGNFALFGETPDDFSALRRRLHQL